MRGNLVLGSVSFYSVFVVLIFGVLWSCDFSMALPVDDQGGGYDCSIGDFGNSQGYQRHSWM